MCNHPFKLSFQTTCGLFIGLIALHFTGNVVQAQDKVFSGPQPGETTTPFKAIELRGDHQGDTLDPIASNAGSPTTLVFVHGIERSMAPLMRVIDKFGSQHKDQLKTDWVFLSDDPIASRQRLPQVGRSLKIEGRMLLSADGIEGPGNYGLNKECLLTIIAAKDNKVAANFALIQPGIADAEAVIGALSKLIGLETPPTIASLSEGMRMAQQRGGGRGENMRQRGQNMRRGEGRPQGGELPGAAPTDDRLVGYLRSFIQRTNSDKRVDQVLDQVRDYIKGNDDLTKQAMNGWIRVLAVKYGTEYAQTKGAAFVEELKKQVDMK